jgi:hypothetical protein
LWRSGRTAAPPEASAHGIAQQRWRASCYAWVDQHDTLGLGNDVPISTGIENDALLALVEAKCVVLRVP